MAGIDSNTKLMLHMNGTDASTTFTDDSGNSHTVTANGDAQIDTAQSKFGGASGLFDGTGDYLTSADSADWDLVGSSSDDWTMDCWVKMPNGAGSYNYTLAVQREDGSNQWEWAIQSTNALDFRVWSGGAIILILNGGTAISDTNWHHVAMIKVGSEYGLYIDGSQQSYTNDSSTDTFAASLTIASFDGFAKYFDGHMDEFRIQNSNYFNASPNSTPNDSFTIPTEEYSEEAEGFAFSQSVIIT